MKGRKCIIRVDFLMTRPVLNSPYLIGSEAVRVLWLRCFHLGIGFTGATVVLGPALRSRCEGMPVNLRRKKSSEEKRSITW